MRNLTLYLHMLLLTGFIDLCQSKVFVLDIMFPWKGFSGVGSHSAGAATVALDDVKSDKMTFPGIHDGKHYFNLTWHDTECSRRLGLPLLVEGFLRQVDAFIGPICSIICEPGGHLVTKWNIPMVSFGSTSSLMSNNKLYPTFARSSAPIAISAPFFTFIFKQLRYNKLAMFAGYEAVWSTAAAAMRRYFIASGLDVMHYSTLERNFDNNGLNNLYEELNTLKQKCKGKDRNTFHAFAMLSSLYRFH